MGKNPFDEDSDVQAMRASMRPAGGQVRWGKVLTGVLVVACVTFALGYYLPLRGAHQALTTRFAELQSKVDSANRAAEEARKRAKELGDKQQALESQADQAKQSEKKSAEASQAIKSALETKLKTAVGKDQASMGVAGSQAVAALSLRYVLSAGKVEVSPQGKVALCAVATASGERPIRVLTVTDKKGIPAALAQKLKTPLQYSAAVSQVVAEALLDKCSVAPARVSAIGVSGEPAASPKHDGKKLGGPRVELWLDSKD
jgi:chemotaxis protein MotB